MQEPLKVDPQVLTAAADGINGIVGELGELGIGETAAAGRGFSLLALSPIEAGKQDVQKALEEFAERWSWGVRHLVQSANSIAQTLGLAAGRYHEMDEQFQGTFKEVWTHLAGNPHLSSEEIRDRSWGETLADNSINHVLNADYSRESFEQAWQVMGQNADVITEVGPQALANVSGVPVNGVAPGWNTGAAQQAASVSD